VRGILDWTLSLTDQLEQWILVIADAWWVYLAVLGLAAGDGFFPSLPSESVIVSLSSLWSSSGTPSIVLLGTAAWMGAWIGDNLGYLIGRTIGWDRFGFLREGRGRRAVEFADRGLQRRALMILMTARYIPLGRTAVNLVAGAVRYPHRKFWPRSLVSTLVWAIYSCLIGAVAGSWFEDNHLVAVTVALIAALILALIVERVISVVHRVLDRRAEHRDEGGADEDAHTGHDDTADEGTDRKAVAGEDPAP